MILKKNHILTPVYIFIVRTSIYIALLLCNSSNIISKIYVIKKGAEGPSGRALS